MNSQDQQLGTMEKFVIISCFMALIFGICQFERWRKHRIERVVGHDISWVDFFVMTAK